MSPKWHLAPASAFAAVADSCTIITTCRDIEKHLEHLETTSMHPIYMFFLQGLQSRAHIRHARLKVPHTPKKQTVPIQSLGTSWCDEVGKWFASGSLTARMLGYCNGSQFQTMCKFLAFGMMYQVISSDAICLVIVWFNPLTHHLPTFYPPFTHHLHAIDHGWWAARPAKCRNQFFGFVGWDNHWDGLPDQDRATVEWKWLSQKFSRDFQRRIVFHVSEKKSWKKRTWDVDFYWVSCGWFDGI